MNMENIRFSEKTVNILAFAVLFFMVCLGIRVALASDLNLKIANHQLQTSNSAVKLESLAKQLEVQAEIIEKKDKAYSELRLIYEGYKRNKVGNADLEDAIAETKNLPEVEDIKQIREKIIKAEDDLLEITTK